MKMNLSIKNSQSLCYLICRRDNTYNHTSLSWKIMRIYKHWEPSKVKGHILMEIEHNFGCCFELALSKYMPASSHEWLVNHWPIVGRGGEQKMACLESHWESCMDGSLFHVVTPMSSPSPSPPTMQPTAPDASPSVHTSSSSSSSSPPAAATSPSALISSSSSSSSPPPVVTSPSALSSHSSSTSTTATPASETSLSPPSSPTFTPKDGEPTPASGTEGKDKGKGKEEEEEEKKKPTPKYSDKELMAKQDLFGEQILTVPKSDKKRRREGEVNLLATGAPAKKQ